MPKRLSSTNRSTSTDLRKCYSRSELWLSQTSALCCNNLWLHLMKVEMVISIVTSSSRPSIERKWTWLEIASSSYSMWWQSDSLTHHPQTTPTLLRKSLSSSTWSSSWASSSASTRIERSMKSIWLCSWLKLLWFTRVLISATFLLKTTKTILKNLKAKEESSKELPKWRKSLPTLKRKLTWWVITWGLLSALWKKSSARELSKLTPRMFHQRWFVDWPITSHWIRKTSLSSTWTLGCITLNVCPLHLMFLWESHCLQFAQSFSRMRLSSDPWLILWAFSSRSAMKKNS